MRIQSEVRVLARPEPHCRRCAAWRRAKTICVSGRGLTVQQGIVSPVDVLVVGEGPGYQEDAEGTAFVGQSGVLLDAFLREYVKGKSFYTTNTYRCFLGYKPNRELEKASAATLEACFAYLDAEVKWLKPKWILCLGQFAAHQVLGVPLNNVSVQRMSGRIHPTRWTGVSALVLHHPSWVLRGGIDDRGDGPNLAAWETEWILSSKLMKGESLVLGGTWKTLDSREDIQALYARLAGTSVVLDYETTGLDPRVHKLRLVGLCGEDGTAWVHPLAEPWQQGIHFRGVQQFREIVCHNAVFDLYWMLIQGGWCPTSVVDTKALGFLLNENQALDLESLATIHVPEYRGWKAASKDVEYDPVSVPEPVLAERCAYDCLATRKLYASLWAAISPTLHHTYRTLVSRLLPLLVRCRARGWRVDIPALAAAASESAQGLAKIERDLLAMPEAEGINPLSSKGVPELLARLGIDDPNLPRQRNNPAALSCNKRALTQLQDKHPVILSILQMRAEIYRASHFYRPLLEQAHLTGGFVYPAYAWGGRVNPRDAGGTVTGRLSCSKPNLMNTPRKGAVKKAFISRFPGGSIWCADYSQLELRLIAAQALEEGLLKIFREGGDPHQATADKLTALLKRPISRDVGKTSNFGLLYGAGVYQFAIVSGLPQNIAAEVRTAWWESYSAIKNYMLATQEAAAKSGTVEGVFGTVLHCPDIWSRDKDEREHAEKRANNYRIQNAGALLTASAMIGVDDCLVGEGLESLLIGQLHDSLILDVYPGEEEAVEEILREVMVERPRRNYGNTWLKVPLDIEIKKGRNMAGDPIS